MVIQIMEATVKESTVQEKRGITGSTLKLIAIITMFIDHVGAVIIERMIMQSGVPDTANEEAMMSFITEHADIYMIDIVLRLIGRLGFPIFCFLLIEGFGFTRNVKKYAGRLFLFALISEIPFDIGFVGEPIYWGYQNVFFTLLIGLLVMIGFRFIENKREWNKALRLIVFAVILLGGMALAEIMRCDYGAIGVLTITVMYLFRHRKVFGSLLGCAALTTLSITEITAFFALIPIRLYNGKRGLNIKWLFYVFYPAHILLLYLVAYALGLGQIMLR